MKNKLSLLIQNQKTFFMIVFLCLMLSVTEAYATTHYVHPDGKDGWSGISTFVDNDNNGFYDDGPYRTIQHDIDQSWPDDIIKVADKAGLDPDYELSAPIQLWDAGEHSGLTVEWWTEGERPQIKGGYGWEAFIISVPDVTIKGFDIYTSDGPSNAGILVKDGADNCNVMNNRCGYASTHKWAYGLPT